ncbi:MAG TPA: hypothetical protein ENL44_02670 [Thermoplasmatales archaeon]|nr:hypothetical protein [Thermoplasmatales archaeon]
MDGAVKVTLAAISIAVLLLASLIYVSLTPSYSSPSGISENNNQENQQPDSGESANQTDNSQQQEKLYPVLCEIGTATWCKYCPKLGEKVYEIYDSGKYPMYVISLIYDKSAAAKERLDKGYNIYGFPTMFIDGGKKVVYGSEASKSEIEKYIKEISQKPKKNLSIDINFDIENNRTINCIIRVKNNEYTPYSGKLMVYLVEINSRWYDYDGKPYRYSLLDFITIESVDIPAGGSESIPSIWTASEKYLPLNKENLMIIAALFSDKTTEKYSDPPDNEHPFDARYLDAISGKRLSEGNLPPQVGFSIPKDGMIHFMSRPVLRNWFGGTVLIGKTTVNFTVRDEGNYVKIRIYMDGKLERIILDKKFKGEKTYTFRLRGPLFGRHTLRIEAIDEYGKSSELSISFFSFILFG